MAIEQQHLDSVPTKLKPAFQKILDDVKARKREFRKVINLL
jgi:hypothetical protein